MSRQAKWAIGVLVGAVLLVTAMILLRPQPEEVDEPASAPLVQTASYTVGSGPLYVLGSGTVQAREEVSLGAQVSGELVYVNSAFREGNRVTRGTVLFRIDRRDFQNQVRTAQADVAAQDVALLEAREEARIAQDELGRFRKREASEQALARAIDENDYAARILPPRELQQPAEAGGLQALDNEEQDNDAPNPLAMREPQLRSAEAAKERAQAQLADAQLALSRTSVRAPFTGLVRSESVSVGTLVQPGQALGSIVASDAFEVRISLTEDGAALIPGLFGERRGQIPADVLLDYSGQVFRWSGVVDRADAILDAETRTIDVFLRVANPLRGGEMLGAEDGTQAIASPPLLLGSFVRARITGASDVPHTEIPIEALRPGNQVWIVREGKLSIVPVRVIQRSDDTASISAAALGEGGQVVTSALRTPVEGMAVRVQGASEVAADE